VRAPQLIEALKIRFRKNCGDNDGGVHCATLIARRSQPRPQIST
jgi:hypothetical protein